MEINQDIIMELALQAVQDLNLDIQVREVVPPESDGGWRIRFSDSYEEFNHSLRGDLYPYSVRLIALKIRSHLAAQTERKNDPQELARAVETS